MVHRTGSDRGYTLTELLIGMTLACLLMGIILAFAVTGVRLWKSGASKATVNENALLAMHALQSYLQGSEVSSAYLNPTGVTAGISFLSGYDSNGILQRVHYTPPPPCSPACPSPGPTCGCLKCLPPYAQDGYIVWQKFQILYLDNTTRTLRLGEVPITASVAPNPYRLNSYTPNATDHIVAYHIIDLEISNLPYDIPVCCVACTSQPTVNPVYVKVTTEEPNKTYSIGNVYSATLTSGITMENGFNLGGNTGEATCPCPPAYPLSTP